MTHRVRRALVTGASSGIGAEFATQLADLGVDLVLVARRRDRLESLASHLDVEVEILPADLREPADLVRVEQRLVQADDRIELLINNAGFGGYGAVAELDADTQAGIIEVNITALVRLTRAALPGFVERGFGGVINVGSTAGFQANPYGAVYGASKAFVLSFTEALHEELRGTEVRAMLCAPGFTETEFQAVAGVVPNAVPRTARMDAATVVSRALEDYAAGRALSVPGALNRVSSTASQLTPNAITRRVSALVHRRFVGM